LRFDGNDDYVSLGDIDSLDALKQMSVSAWIKRDDLANWDAIIDKGGVTNNGWGLRIRNSDEIAFFDGSGNDKLSTGKIIDTNWHHVLVTLNGSLITFYLDGRLDSTSTAAGIQANAIPVYIGQRDSNTDRFDGNIDEVKVWNYTLTSWQIAQVYNGGKPTYQFSFNEGRGVTAYNTYVTSTNGPVGTLYNMSTSGTSTDWVTGKVDKALSFDGLNDMITVPYSSDLNYSGGDMSWSVWVNPASSEADGGNIISKPWNGSGGYNYRLFFNSNRTLSLLFIGASSYTLTTTDKIPFNQWSHLSFTVEGPSKIVKIYINGKLSKQSVHTITDWNPASGNTSIKLAIGTLYPYGAWAGNTTYSFKGLLDEVNYYTYVLSPAQIASNYNDNVAVSLGSLDNGQNIQNGLVGYWPMDEATSSWTGAGVTINDYSNNGSNCTSTGDALATTTAKYGNGGYFDGSGDYLNCGTSNFSISDQVTASAWFKVLGVPGTGYHIIFVRGSVDIELDVSQAGALRTGIYNAAGTRVSFNSGSGLADGNWHFLTMTYDGSLIKAYADGVLIGSSPQSGLIRTGGSAYIGQYTSTYYANGVIDEVKLYNIARTPDQIMQDYLQGPGPVAYYSFNEGSGTTLNDRSGQGNTGTITPGSGGWVVGKIGPAYDFDGANTKILTTIIDNAYFNSGFTISAWIKPDSLGEANSARIVDKSEDGTTGTNGFAFYIGGTNQIALRLNGAPVPLSDNNAITPGRWTHVVVTVSPSALVNFYSNGILTGTANQQANALTQIITANALAIGNYTVGATRTFDGQIDDLKIYNYALTPWQVAQEYNGGKPIGYWKLDDGQGSIIKDYSGNSNNGTLSLSGSPATSSAWQASTNCKLNGCLSFDGSNDYISVSEPVLTLGGTISAWVKTTDTSARIISLDGILIGIQNSTTMFICADGSGCGVSVGAQSVPRGNIWTHIAMTWNNSTLYYYYNGQLVTAVADTGFANANRGSYLGAGDGGAGIADYFSGLLDEVKVYNYLRSTAQVREDYNMGKGIFFK
jgi:hypothetical protein